MSLSGFDAPAYLRRIGLSTPTRVSAKGLDTLHRAQAFSIPFENFDILLGRGINLDKDAVFNKLVNHRRGGYCFELNGLFLRALIHFGFTARPLLARVHIRGMITGRSHQLSLVTIDGEDWLADVGFGGNGMVAPLPLETGKNFLQNNVTYRLIEQKPFGTMLQVLDEHRWSDLYSFDLTHVTEEDIKLGNYFTSTHP